MRERGKAIETESFNGFSMSDFNYSASSEFPCRKHPSSSSVGICALCLKERLINLVCSDCGEHRLSSCSCSCSSSHEVREVGSVGRVSFLIENERSNETQNSPFRSNPIIDHHHHQIEPREFLSLKRSSSSCVEAKKTGGGGFRKIGRFFRRKVRKGEKGSNSVSNLDYLPPVSRSRSLCSFRGGGIRDTEDSTSDFTFSSAKISDVNGGSMMESARISCFSCETEPRKSGFMVSDDSAFIDLKLDLSSSAERTGDLNIGPDRPVTVSSVENGGSYRIRVNDGEVKTKKKKKKKKDKVWKWIVRHHPSWSKSSPKERDR